MKVLSLVLFVGLAASLLVWIIRSRRPRPKEIEAVKGAVVAPNNVTLPEEDDSADRRERKRTGETQELRHKIVHGEYRPIEDRGAPSEVRTTDKQ